MTNEEIVERIRDEPQDKNLLLIELYNQNQGIIHQVSKRYNGLIEYDDMMQESFLTLIETVNYYDHEQGTFVSLFEKMLKYHFTAFYRNKGTTIRIPYNLHDKVKKYEELKENHTETEIRALLKVSKSELETIKQAQSINVIDIESKSPYTDLKISDSVADEQINLEDDVIHSIWNDELRKVFEEIMKEYSARDRDILIQTVCFDVPLKILSDKYKINVERIRQIQHRMIGKIKHSKHFERLEELDRYSSGAQKIAKNGFYNSTTERTAIEIIIAEMELNKII